MIRGYSRNDKRIFKERDDKRIFKESWPKLKHLCPAPPSLLTKTLSWSGLGSCRLSFWLWLPSFSNSWLPTLSPLKTHWLPTLSRQIFRLKKEIRSQILDLGVCNILLTPDSFTLKTHQLPTLTPKPCSSSIILPSPNFQSVPPPIPNVPFDPNQPSPPKCVPSYCQTIFSRASNLRVLPLKILAA